MSEGLSAPPSLHHLLVSLGGLGARQQKPSPNVLPRCAICCPLSLRLHRDLPWGGLGLQRRVGPQYWGLLRGMDCPESLLEWRRKSQREATWSDQLCYPERQKCCGRGEIIGWGFWPGRPHSLEPVCPSVEWIILQTELGAEGRQLG